MSKTTTKSALAALMAALTILSTASGCGETSANVSVSEEVASAVSNLIEADNSSSNNIGTADTEKSVPSSVPPQEQTTEISEDTSVSSKGDNISTTEDTSDEISEISEISEDTSVSSKGDNSKTEEQSSGESSPKEINELYTASFYKGAVEKVSPPEETEEIVEYSTESSMAAETTEESESSEMIEAEVETLHLTNGSFMTMHEFGAAGDIHKDALLEVNLEYKGVIIPKGYVLRVWSKYGDSSYVILWYDKLLCLPQRALQIADSPISNLYRSAGLDEKSALDIHSDLSIKLPTKKLVMLEETSHSLFDSEGTEYANISLHKGEEIEVFDFMEYENSYLLKQNGYIWKLNLPNVRFVDPTFGLYTHGAHPLWVRVLEEHWYQFEDLEPFDRVFTIQWGWGNQMIDGEKISIMEPSFPVFPVIENDGKLIQEAVNKYARIQGMFDVDFPANPGFYKTVPAGTVVYVEGKTVDGEYLITWYDHLIKIPHYMLKFDASIIERDGYLFNKSGSLREPLMSAGLYYKPGIIGGADYLYCKDP